MVQTAVQVIDCVGAKYRLGQEMGRVPSVRTNSERFTVPVFSILYVYVICSPTASKKRGFALFVTETRGIGAHPVRRRATTRRRNIGRRTFLGGICISFQPIQRD
jgi:hypothetical protein